MLRLLLGVSLTLTCSAASVTTYYNYSAFENAIGSGSFTTESFAGNQINTPGLTISDCYAPGYGFGNFTESCQQLSKLQLNSTTQFQYITQNMFTDAVGRVPSNPYSGEFGVNEFTTVFKLPASVTAAGFDVNEKDLASNPISNFGITLGSNIPVYPFGGVEGPSDPFAGLPNSGYPYDGFVGFISDTPFNTIEFSAFYNPGIAYTLDNLSLGDPVPEPSTASFLGFGILVFGLSLRKVIGRS